ncbi:2-dehydro-3-deoxygalactonokinase [Maritalea sp.]|uniref:2-dehydro-3-deoxygalactonokinase n=1 Tax=Maritalea sp. TaxID=2003361 RepID=UPI003EF7C253
MNNKIEWIALDWGTTHFRAWAMGPGGQILDHVKSDQGMGSLKQDQFEPVFIQQIEPWLAGRTNPLIAFACGMVGAKQGWIEAAYLSTPCTPPRNQQLVEAPTADPRVQVLIVPGLSQDKPADVMRGEETQIAGFLASMPTFSGVVCLPGTHSKWATVENGTVKHFTTFMTGELFGLLSKNSVLRHSVGGRGWDSSAFIGGVKLSMETPEQMGQELFAIRPQSMLHDLPANEARARLSGLLIGMELRATEHLWSSNDVCIIGDPKLAEHYNRALGFYNCQPTIADGDMMTLGGLHAVAVSALEQAS